MQKTLKSLTLLSSSFGRYYKFDIPATVKKDIKAGVDIENTATQVVNYYNPTTKKVEKPNVPMKTC